MDISKLAKNTARKQKRFIYLKSEFEKARIPDLKKQELFSLLQTYRHLIEKLAKSSSESELNESDNRLATLDRELVRLFESYRLSKSKLSPITK